MKKPRLWSNLSRSIGLAALVTLFLAGCTRPRAPLGTEENPIKFFFVPSVDVKMIEDKSKTIQAFLEKNTPYKYKFSVPPSFIAVVEAFGTNRADVAAINTFGYILANNKYKAEARLMTIRSGESNYRAQFLARADGPIKRLEDLEGKKVAFVDPMSTSGYLLPLKILKDRKIAPKETMFAMRHDSVVSMIYQRQVDAGATFYSAPVKNEIQDARRLVKTQHPDVEEVIKIVELTTPIPNDPVVFRHDLPEEMKNTIVQALIAFVKTPEGLDALEKLTSVTGLIPATDKDYDGVRAMLESLGKSSNELVK